MNLSYWEIKSWLTHIDYTIIGSGIVGLSCAIHLKERFPHAKVLILEKGILPQGASTKNAGFACFGSLSEIIDDFNTHTEPEVLQLIRKRIDGLNILRQTLGDQNIEFKNYGGYELFSSSNGLFEECLSMKDRINTLLKPFFNDDVFSLKAHHFGFKNVNKYSFFNKYEGQIDTGKMMEALLEKVRSQGIKILNNCAVESYIESHHSVKIKTSDLEFSSSKLFIATNGFAHQFLDEDLKPARAQVLITKPINNLNIKGTFHLEKGYYYFRNIDNRILLGGGRHLDFKTEETTEFAQTKLIQNSLEALLRDTILPDTPFEIDHRWSGIMGVGNQKKAIVKPLSDHVYCGVRLGGMGVAIGSLIGKELADLV